MTERDKAILKARAAALASEERRQATVDDSLEAVEFLLADEHYALESAYVQQIYPLKQLTPVPGLPPFIRGVIQVHGRIASVVDLKKFFELPEKGLTDLNKVILLNDGRMEFGVLADTIIGLRDVLLKDIQPALPTLTNMRRDFIRGITSERLIVMDPARLLSDPRMVIRYKAEI